MPTLIVFKQHYFVTWRRALAYLQLYLVAPLAQLLPRPWESSAKADSDALLSPSAVQRDFSRIIQHIGTPASSVKTRGISPGRAKGFKPTARKLIPIVFKSNKQSFLASPIP